MTAESLILDIDGTLWDSRQLVAEGYNRQLQQEGLEHLSTTAEALTSLFGLELEKIADVLFASIPVPERYALASRCMQRENVHMQQDPCRIGYPKVAETLEKLRKKHRLFIVSNSELGYPELCMDKLGVRQYFEGWMCYGNTHRPKGETIRILMEKYGVRDAVYVGDTQGDYEAAVLVGIPFVWASYGFGKPEAYDASISAFSELTALFEEDSHGNPL